MGSILHFRKQKPRRKVSKKLDLCGIDHFDTWVIVLKISDPKKRRFSVRRRSAWCLTPKEFRCLVFGVGQSSRLLCRSTTQPALPRHDQISSGILRIGRATRYFLHRTEKTLSSLRMWFQRVHFVLYRSSEIHPRPEGRGFLLPNR